MAAVPEYSTVHPGTRKQWRQWLQKNHHKCPGVWFIYYKKESGKPRVSYADAVEEALCFGWIDSLPRKLDDERTMLKFTPRKPKSMWSKLNKNRIEKLLQAKLVSPAGLAAIELAKRNGSWNILDTSDELASSNSIPADLEKLFRRNKKARDNFHAFAPSIRKQFLYWIDSAKRPETRAARLQQTVLMSAANKKPGPKGFIF